MKAADGVAVFRLTSSVLGHDGTIFPVLVWDDESAVLVDTGYPGHARTILDEIRGMVKSIRILKAIILTHQDIDHTGGGANLLAEIGSEIETISHASEAPYIRGELRPLKLASAAVDSIVGSLPPGVPREKRDALRYALEHPPVMPVTRECRGNEFLPWCGGITLLDTPGHTPGHMSAYHHPSRTLIAGDCLTAKDGVLELPEPSLCTDYDQAKRSIRSLLEPDIERVVCYHGGIVSGDVRGRLRELCL